jgi:4-carboxymuconolactone decarboxylase
MDRESRKQALAQKYAGPGFDAAMRLQDDARFLRVLDELDQMDEGFTRSWLDHIYGHMYSRGKIDDRTRALVVIGECVVSGSDYAYVLPLHIGTALRAGATKEEVLEIILQAHVYAGLPKMINALRIFRRVMQEQGLWDLPDSVFADASQE